MTTHHTPTYYRVRTLVRCAFVTGVALLAFSIGKALAQDPYTYECDGSAVVVAAGDTLWSLTDEHCKGHIGHAVYDISKVYDSQVQVGDIISFSFSRK